MNRGAMNWAALLLADPSPNLRLLALRELLERSADDPEVMELSTWRETDALVADLLRLQDDDGSWRPSELAGLNTGDKFRRTWQALLRLGYLGFGAEHPAVRRGAEFLFTEQRADGAWPLPDEREEGDEREGYSMKPLQTAFPLRALAMCSYASDPRAEAAYEWLLAQRLPDGAWPTGIASGNYGRVAGYRRLAHSRWGCRSNTTGALLCLAHHPQRCHSAEAQRALDLLLGRETKEQYALGFEVARLIGAEPARGFLTYYARFDLALILDLVWRIGASREDERVVEIVRLVSDWQGANGLWEYASRPQVSRWVTFDLLRSLSRLDAASEWLSLEPRTPFQTYNKRMNRF
jgi:hypothetical protein